MADTKLADLTALTAPSGDDLLYVVDDPAGTPSDKKLALDNLFTRGTVTVSSPVIDAAQTWNDGGVTFTGLKFNATDTASASGSLLMDLQVGGASKLKVDKTGLITSALAGAGGILLYGGFSGYGVGFDGSGGLSCYVNNALRYRLATNLELSNVSNIAWCVSNASTAIDTFLGRRAAASLRLGAADAAAPVAQFLSVQGGSGTDIAGQPFTIEASRSTGTAAGGSILFHISPAGGLSGTAVNTPVIFGEMTSTRRLSLYNTFTDATTFERANIFWDSNVLKIGTEKGSVGGTARALEFQTDGTTRLTIASTSGDVTTTGSVTTAAPAGGTAAAWKLGAVASVTPTLQNRTIEVDIGGTIYYISAKTTND